jgi:hypothetical protein
VADDRNDIPWQIGDFVVVGGSIGVAVPLPATWACDPDDPGGLDHVGVWYGRYDDNGPLVRTVPTEYVTRAPLRFKPMFRPV